MFLYYSSRFPNSSTFGFRQRGGIYPEISGAISIKNDSFSCPTLFYEIDTSQYCQEQKLPPRHIKELLRLLKKNTIFTAKASLNSALPTMDLILSALRQLLFFSSDFLISETWSTRMFLTLVLQMSFSLI